MKIVSLLIGMLFADVANAQSPDPRCQSFPYACSEFRGELKVKADIKTLNGSLVIGDTTTNSKAIAEFKSTNKGVLFPRITTTQMNALNAPPTGLMIYNTDSAALCSYQGGWKCYGRASTASISNTNTQVIEDTTGYTAGTTPTYTHALGGQPTIRTVEYLQDNVWKPVDLLVTVNTADNPNSKISIQPANVTISRIRITLVRSN